MPARRVKTLVLLAAASLLILFYLTTGGSTTQSSEFYTRTVAAMNARVQAEQERLTSKVGLGGAATKANDANVAAVAAAAGDRNGALKPAGKNNDDEGLKVPAAGKVKDSQKPLADDVVDAVKGAKDAAAAKGKGVAADIADAVHGTNFGSEGQGQAGEKTVAGRKKYGSGSAADDGTGKKVVKEGGDENDGVAKVGNTGKHVQDSSSGLKAGVDGAAGGETPAQTEEEREIEVALDGILKRSPGESAALNQPHLTYASIFHMLHPTQEDH